MCDKRYTIHTIIIVNGWFTKAGKNSYVEAGPVGWWGIRDKAVQRSCLT